ncbi:MAG TPA: TolC family protein [Desulfobulbus sp.]|nr:TolC family protein [Desulfobulbus sp.]
MPHREKKCLYRCIRVFILIGLVLPAGGVSASVPEDNCEKLSLDDAVAVAMEKNPSLAAIQARYEAMAAIPSQQSSLPDPILSFGAVNIPLDTFNLDQENMTQMQVGISQKFPFPGKLGLKEKSAAFEAEAVLEQVGEARLDLVKKTRTTWWDIFYLQKSLKIVRSNQDLLRATVAAARTKYEVGKGLQQDVLLAQVELSRLLDREIFVANAIDKKKAVLAALLDRPADAGCFEIPEKHVDLELPKILPMTTLQTVSLTSRPGLLALEKKTDATKSRIELARKDYYPDFTVGAAYGYRQDTPDGRDRSDFASIRLSINLPIWTGTKQDKAVAQRTSESLEAEHKVRDYRNRVLADIASEFAEFSNTSRQSELYRTSLIPQAEQTAAAMLKGYQVNKVDFLNVVRAQLALYNYKITYWNYLSNAFKALAGLEAATGASVYEGEQQ